MVNKERTRCYAYFNIRGIFDPVQVTKILGVTPHESNAIGDLGVQGLPYRWASWSCSMTRVDYPNHEIECIKVVKELIGKEDLLNQIKASNEDVEFWLEIVPTICEGEPPVITFGKEVIQFCHLTGTDFDLDMYVYPFEEQNSELD